MLKKLLPSFSYIFHPIFICLYGTLFYFLFVPHINSTNMIYLTLIQVTILTLLLPLAIYFLLVTLGYATSFTEATIKERKIPILIQAIVLFTLLQINKYTYNTDLYYFYLAGFCSSILAFISVLFKFKCSLHMIAISTLVTFIYIIVLKHELPFINIVAFSVVCAGLVASSRLYMKSHTVSELLVGLFIGIISQVICFLEIYKI